MSYEIMAEMYAAENNDECVRVRVTVRVGTV